MTRQSICVITHPLGAAGENATRSLLDILGHLSEVTLVTANLPKESTIRDRFDFVELNESAPGDSILLSASRFILNQLRMTREIYHNDAKIVLFFGATAYLLPIIFSKLLGRTVILQPRGDVPLTLRLTWERRTPSFIARWLADSVGLMERIGYRVADAIIVYTPSMVDQLNLSKYESKIHTNGARYVNSDEFTREIPIEDRDPIVGFLGRLDEEKGIRMLAQAALQSSEANYRFVGDGDLRIWLECELSAKIDEGSVEVRGWVPHAEVPEQLNDFKLLILPSQPTEGLPTAILEAFACGTPVYATEVSGVPDVVREGQTGFLMDEMAPEDISRRIESILNRDDLGEISNNCRSLIESEYDYEAAVERYRNILNDITCGGKHEQ